MTLHMFTYFNKYLKCSSQITFDDHEPLVFKENMLRACKMAELPKLKEAKRNTRLLYLGIYDDEKMSFEVCEEPEILIDFDDVIAEKEVFEARVHDEKAKEEGDLNA